MQAAIILGISGRRKPG